MVNLVVGWQHFIQRHSKRPTTKRPWVHIIFSNWLIRTLEQYKIVLKHQVYQQFGTTRFLWQPTVWSFSLSHTNTRVKQTWAAPAQEGSGQFKSLARLGSRSALKSQQLKPSVTNFPATGQERKAPGNWRSKVRHKGSRGFARRSIFIIEKGNKLVVAGF